MQGTCVPDAACDGGITLGRFQSAHAETLALESDTVTSPVGCPIERERNPVALPLARRCTYQVSEGYGSHSGSAALIGAALGLVITSAAVAADKAQASDGSMFPGTALAVPLVLLTTGLGALIGARRVGAVERATFAAGRDVPSHDTRGADRCTVAVVAVRCSHQRSVDSDSTDRTIFAQ